MGFTKLDQGIIQSSIMLEDSDTFKAWIVFLAACGSDGIARVSPVYISSICHFSIEKTLEIINKLESPDPLSRSINDEGKRIERIDGGFRIINYLKYREYTYSDSKEAIKKRKQRGHKGDMSPFNGDTLSSVLLSSALKDKEKIQEEEKETQYNQGGKNEEVEKTAKRGRKGLGDGLGGGLEDGRVDPRCRAKQIPPELEWVKEYCLERKNHVDADRFFDYYEARGWIPNNSKRLLKNWQAAVRHWERSEYRAPEPAFHGVTDSRGIEVEP
jgi:hypothetical protein